MEKAIVNFDDSALKLEYDATGPSAVVYDFEGNVISGGGGSSLLTCTITFINSTGASAAVSFNPNLIANKINTEGLPHMIAAGGELVLDAPYVYVSESEGCITVYAFDSSMNALTMTASNEVNCEADFTDPEYPLVNTSADVNSSITITIS